MESGKRDVTRTQRLQSALKIKDSKTGQAILKDNVFEEAKLEDEIHRINHIQQKKAIRLRWEKEYAIKVLSGKNLLKRQKSTPDKFTFPPITKGSVGSLERTRSEETRSVRMSSEDSSPELSPYNSLEDVFAKQRVFQRQSLARSPSEITSLPALLSPQLMRKVTTKDPRFTNLLRQLVPQPEPHRVAKNQDSDDK